METTSTGI